MMIATVRTVCDECGRTDERTIVADEYGEINVAMPEGWFRSLEDGTTYHNQDCLFRAHPEIREDVWLA